MVRLWVILIFSVNLYNILYEKIILKRNLCLNIKMCFSFYMTPNTFNEKTKHTWIAEMKNQIPVKYSMGSKKLEYYNCISYI